MTEEKQLEPATPAENMPAWREVFFYFLMLSFINIGRTRRPDNHDVQSHG